MKANIFQSYTLKFRLTLIFLVGILFSCDDNFLDKQPLDRLSTATFWKTEKDAMLALTGVYHLEGTSSTGAKQQYSFWNQDTYLRVFEATTDNGFEKDDGEWKWMPPSWRR